MRRLATTTWRLRSTTGLVLTQMLAAIVRGIVWKMRMKMTFVMEMKFPVALRKQLSTTAMSPRTTMVHASSLWRVARTLRLATSTCWPPTKTVLVNSFHVQVVCRSLPAIMMPRHCMPTSLVNFLHSDTIVMANVCWTQTEMEFVILSRLLAVKTILPATLTLRRQIRGTAASQRPISTVKATRSSPFSQASLLM